ncbi:MAG: bifunctional tRNA (5-methylaminomethyl-2-thiouridine)(34)-methyltransferase MnmD/FAD-dependent 5-carboxymethylaminomethyl-2-thiouridine(34) oxidoreductase MnmC [Pseudomonadota bacterium]
MTDSSQPTLPTQAELTFKNGVPCSERFDDVYFSIDNGLEETRYNFIEHNHLANRWRALEGSSLARFIIAETGFGSGLNLLACMQLWKQVRPHNGQLYFLSAEKYPMTLPQLRQSLAARPELHEEASALIEQYPATTPGLHAIYLGDGITLQLFIGDVHDALEQWLPTDSLYSTCSSSNPQAALPISVDAWFLDGFAPSKNPDMWTPRLFQDMALLSHVNSTFATFTAAGDVKRGLENAGFDVYKDTGYGRKRNMLYGNLSKTPSSANALPPPKHSNWSAYHYPSFKKQHVTIIGGGLAGCITAYELAHSGWRVTVIEQKDIIVDATSGNRQSVLYSRLSWPSDYLTDFNLSAFQFSGRYFSHLMSEFNMDSDSGALCGTLQLAYNDKESARLHAVYHALSASNPDVCEFVTAEQTEHVTGIPIDHDGVLFNRSGWINPARFCHHLMQHPNITTLTSTRAMTLTRCDEGWLTHATSNDDTLDIQSSAVVLCNSASAQTLLDDYSFPMKLIRGQVSHFDASEASEQLKRVICHKGYTAPAWNGQHDSGATFTLHDDHPNVTHQDHLDNFALIESQLPHLASRLSSTQDALKQQHAIAGRTGFRCSTTDYLPLVGPINEYSQLSDAFQEFRHHATKPLIEPVAHRTGLFMNVAHGSRGLCSIPFASAHIASLLNHTPSPISQDMQRTLHPARFLIRDVKKRRC